MSLIVDTRYQGYLRDIETLAVQKSKLTEIYEKIHESDCPPLEQFFQGRDIKEVLGTDLNKLFVVKHIKKFMRSNIK